MISDEMLSKAAARSSEIFVRYLERDYDPENQHVFSPGFEKKMKRLIRKANRSGLYRSMQRIASVLLALLIGGVMWISVDTKARAAFFGWVRELYETYIVYSFKGGPNGSAEATLYRPAWLPDGYREIYMDDEEDIVIMIYGNGGVQTIVFSYTDEPKGLDWILDTSEGTVERCYVNGVLADALIADNVGTASSIAWTSGDVSFFLTGYLSKNDLIRIAESVKSG